MFEERSKCGEVFFNKNGNLSCLCLMCDCSYENLLEFTNHILEIHFNVNFLNELNNYCKNNIEQLSEISDNNSTAGSTKFKNKSNSEETYLYDSLNIDEKNENDSSNLSTKVDIKIEILSSEESTNDKNNILELITNNSQLTRNKFEQEYMLDKHESFPYFENVLEKSTSFIDHSLESFPYENDNNEIDFKYNYDSDTQIDEIKMDVPKIKELSVEKNFKNSFDLDKNGTIKLRSGENENKKPYVNYYSTEFLKSKSLGKFEELNKTIETCQYCGKIFRNQNKNFRLHIKSHTGEKLFSCTFCSKSFTTRGKLNYHKSIYHTVQKQYTCTWLNCGKVFKKDRQRVWHERIHTGEKPYQCEECGQRFSFQHKLSLHKKRNHMDKSNRPHKCDQCGKLFLFPGQLKEHIYTHTGEKPIRCDICPARFAKKNALREHKKLHTGLKNHVCEVCGKAFAQRAGYATHFKLHRFV